MKQGCLAVCCSLLLALSANATFLQIERQVATPNLLIFDIFWQNPGSEGGLVDGTFLDADGRPLWQAGVKDQFPDSIRLLDVKVQMWGPGFQYSEDLWSFYVDEQ